MPLHRGHQLLIESALSQVDDLTVVVYDSHPEGDYPAMPAHTRASWVYKLYPTVENVIVRRDPLDELTGPVVAQDERDDPKMAPVYAQDLEFLGKFDYVFSSEDYGQPFAEALGAKNVVVDQARTMLPISGTQIRENIFENRGWIDPVVYRDLIQKVVFVGTESAGKSTISARMAQELNTSWVHEYGRELWEAQNLQGSFHDMWKIAQNHYKREEAAVRNANRFLFCDTNPWITLQWSLMYSGTADQRLYDLVERTKHEYIWILCHNDFGWVQDGTRELAGNKSIQFQHQIRRSLEDFGVYNQYQEIGGTIDQRVEQVKNILGVKDVSRV